MADVLGGASARGIGLFFKSVAEPDIQLAGNLVGEHDSELGTLAFEPNLNC